MIENTVFEMPVIVYGKVLNLGLGKGSLVKRLLKNSMVTKVVSVELDPGVASDAEVDERHEVIVGDGVEFYKLHGDEFDFVVQDLYNTDLGHHHWIKVGGFAREEIAWESV